MDVSKRVYNILRCVETWIYQYVVFEYNKTFGLTLV